MQVCQPGEAAEYERLGRAQVLTCIGIEQPLQVAAVALQPDDDCLIGVFRFKNVTGAVGGCAFWAAARSCGGVSLRPEIATMVGLG